MSVTYSGTTFAPARKRRVAARHPQLMPFLVAVGITVVSTLVSLAFTGLPA
jgi:hypothetical protein